MYIDFMSVTLEETDEVTGLLLGPNGIILLVRVEYFPVMLSDTSLRAWNLTHAGHSILLSRLSLEC